MIYSKKNTGDYLQNDYKSDCNIVCIHVTISNIEDEVQNMLNKVRDISWISSLGAIDQYIYNATSKRTIEDISTKIKEMDKAPLTTSVGEYLMSFTAQNTLVEVCGHTSLPIAELLKEKVSGNPGFDYHTISQDDVLIFGEAKYSKEGTPKDNAIDQISSFIELKKDYAELHSLLPLIKKEVQDKILVGIKGYAAAFSLNMRSVDLAFKNALKMETLKSVTDEHAEYYIIAIQIC